VGPRSRGSQLCESASYEVQSTWLLWHSAPNPRAVHVAPWVQHSAPSLSAWHVPFPLWHSEPKPLAVQEGPVVLHVAPSPSALQSPASGPVTLHSEPKPIAAHVPDEAVQEAPGPVAEQDDEL
jgi:hypothetical protein